MRRRSPVLPTRWGIIDVGTNAMHLYIGVVRDGRWHLLVREHELPRLGGGGLVRGRLTAAAMARGMRMLTRYAARLAQHRVDHVEAVATSAVRDAANGPAFVRRVRRETGISLRIISGREEARLIYRGVLRVHRVRRPTVIISIGGGSTQVMCGDGAPPRYLVSIPLGGARLAQRFIQHDPPRPGELRAMEAFVRRAWAPIVRAVRRHRWTQAWGSSATIEHLTRLAYGQTHPTPPAADRTRWLTPASLRRVIQAAATRTAAERRQLPGVDPRREDMIVTTGAVLLAFMAGCGIRRLRFAPGSLREGLLADAERFVTSI